MARHIKGYKCIFFLQNPSYFIKKYNKINEAYRKLLSFEDDDLLLRTVAHTGNYFVSVGFDLLCVGIIVDIIEDNTRDLLLLLLDHI